MVLTFAQKTSAGITALVAVLLGAVLSVSGLWITEAIKARIDKDLAAADETVAEVLRIRSRELSVQTRMLADVPHLRAVIDTPGLDHATVLDSAQSARRLVGSDLLMLVDDRAHLLASATEPKRRGDNLVGNPAVSAALAGELFEGMLATDDGIYQIVAAPIEFEDEVAGAIVTGFIVGDLLLTTLEEMTNSSVALWSDSVAKISDRARPVFGDLATRLVATPGATTSIDTAAGRYLVRVGRIGSTGVSYALARSLDSELAFYHDLRRRLLATGVVILMVSLLLGFLYSRRVTKPIRSLVTQTARLAAGDLSSRVDVSSHDEVGRLADAFNKMAADIQSRVEEQQELAASRAALNSTLEKVNAQLKVEIDAHQQAENEVKTLNEELEARVARRTAELEAANQQLESFSYSVSHDLRGPLRRIIAFSELLLEDAGPRLDAGNRHSLERIRTSAVGMGTMIEKLLEFAHVGRSRLQRETVNVSEMARSILEELASADPDRQADIIVADDLVAAGDDGLVRIALSNLLSNAWKFTRHLPRARIEVGAATDEDGRRYFFVRDNGAGFEAVDSHKLFRVFERLHSAHEFEGHGIGLATVKRIVEHHGGRISANGSPGTGATFRFALDEA